MATLHASLPYNTLSNLVVGNVNTDAGIVIDYSCSRGSLFQAGVIKLLNRGTTIEVFHRSFGDDIGISDVLSPVSGDIDGSNIRLNITVNNTLSTNVTFNYNLSLINF